MPLARLDSVASVIAQPLGPDSDPLPEPLEPLSSSTLVVEVEDGSDVACGSPEVSSLLPVDGAEPPAVVWQATRAAAKGQIRVIIDPR